VKVTQYPQYADFGAHAKRRNDVVHGGQELDQESAEASVRVVRGLWLWLNDEAGLP
jgi:hypothetical protein